MIDIKAILAMILVQMSFAGQDILFKLAILDGMNIRVLVTYRLIFATVFMFPVALIFQWNKRPSLTWRMIILAFVSGLLGAAGPNILVAEGLARSTATFISVSFTLVPLITYLLAGILGLESLGLGSNHGKAKIVGTFLGFGGTLIFAVLKGKEIHLVSTGNHRYASQSTISVLGAFLVLGSALSYSIWILVQAKIGQALGGCYWNTFLMNLMGAFVTILSSVSVGRKDWVLGWNVRLIASVFSGVGISGFAFAVTVWCVEANGPVFASAFSPIRLVLVAVVASVFLGESIYAGSIIGTVVIVLGLYLVLWAKKKESETESSPVPEIV